jgi:hypothetical protein
MPISTNSANPREPRARGAVSGAVIERKRRPWNLVDFASVV